MNARMVARKEERKERFTALLAVDAGWLKKRKESRRMKREAREMAKREEEGGMDKEGGSDDDSSSIPPSLPPHLRLALDIHYGESIHGLRGTRSLTQQVGWCYHSLKRASSFHNTPIFHITSFQGLTAEMLKGSGAHNWPIYRHEEELLAVFPRQSIIYLSPDAEDVLMGPLDLSKGKEGELCVKREREREYFLCVFLLCFFGSTWLSFYAFPLSPPAFPSSIPPFLPPSLPSSLRHRRHRGQDRRPWHLARGGH